jgi:hypothetical protein
MTWMKRIETRKTPMRPFRAEIGDEFDGIRLTRQLLQHHRTVFHKSQGKKVISNIFNPLD